MRLLAAAVALCLATPALAVEVAGVQVPETASIRGKPVVLNGAGIRSKLFVKVYVGALYLTTKGSDAAAVLGADEPWLVTMTFKRGVEKDKILGAFKEGFENNSRADLPVLLSSLQAVEPHLKDFKEGETFTIGYLPEVGAVLTPPGGAAPITVHSRPFAAALLRNWLGDQPADSGLKKAMLGK